MLLPRPAASFSTYSLMSHTYVWHWELRLCFIWQEIGSGDVKINDPHFKGFFSLYFSRAPDAIRS